MPCTGTSAGNIKGEQDMALAFKGVLTSTGKQEQEYEMESERTPHLVSGRRFP